MEPSRESGKKLLAIGLITDEARLPYKIDISLTMEDIIKKICEDFRLANEPKDMGLWLTEGFLNNGTKWITDENKCQIATGSILQFKESAKQTAHFLIDDLLRRGTSGLEEFIKKTSDPSILKYLCEAHAEDIILNFLKNNSDHNVWYFGLKYIGRLFSDRKLRKVPSDVVSKAFVFISQWSFYPKRVIIQCMELLSQIRRLGRLRYDDKLFENLRNCLKDSNDSELQTASLLLLNYLVIFPNDREEEIVATQNVVNSEMVECIYKNILPAPGKEMQQQLYRFQTLALRHYWTKKVTKVKSTDPVIKTIRDLTKMAKKGDFLRKRHVSENPSLAEAKLSKNTWSTVYDNINVLRWARKDTTVQNESSNTDRSSKVLPPSRIIERITRPLSPVCRRTSRMAPKFYSCIQTEDSGDEITSSNFPLSFEFYGPIELVDSVDDDVGSITTTSGIKRSNSTPAFEHVPEEIHNYEGDGKNSKFTISLLTVGNLKYLGKHNPKLFQKWCLRKGKKYEFAESLTQMICRLLEIGKSRHIEETFDGYHPLFFRYYPYFLELLFSEALELFAKTSKEMKTRFESDIPKVLGIMKRQLSRALSGKPQDLENFWLFLNATPYEAVEVKIQAEIKEQMQYDLAHKPLFLEYRETCNNGVKKLIEDQRMSFMRHGQHLLRVNFRGEVNKSSRQSLVLSKNGENLLTRECKFYNDCDDCSSSRDVTTIKVCDIINISFGKQSPFYSEMTANNSDLDPFFRPRAIEPQHWTRLFSLKMEGSFYHHFCAEDDTSLQYWVDGIHLLMGNSMSSPMYEKEAQMLLDMEVRLHFLDLEGIPIPDSPPTLPPMPSDFDFHYKKKKRQLQSIRT